MARHRAVGPDRDPALPAPRREQATGCHMVAAAEEGGLQSVAALGDGMGNAGCN
jgi:hypothetical protein